MSCLSVCMSIWLDGPVHIMYAPTCLYAVCMLYACVNFTVENFNIMKEGGMIEEGGIEMSLHTMGPLAFGRVSFVPFKFPIWLKSIQSIPRLS